MSATLAEPKRTGAATTGETEKDPLRELVEGLDQRRGVIAGSDQYLNKAIKALVEEAAKPGRTDDPEFRTRVAFVVQDFGKLAGPGGVAMPEPLRVEMESRATSIPNLQNAKLQEMVRETGDLTDRKLVNDVRKVALEVAREGGDQNRPDVATRVEALERRFVAAANPTPSMRATTASDASNSSAPVPASASATMSAPEKPKAEERVHAAASPGEGWRQPPTTEATRQLSEPGAQVSSAARHQGNTSPEQPAADATSLRGPGVMGRVMSAMAGTDGSTPAPWDPQPTPIGDRIAEFVAKFGDTKTFERAEVSGQRAAEALKGFTEGVGASIMNRINDAARSDPRGIEDVLSEMREGGRHAELRSAFNNALSTEKSLAAGYDAATSALKQYGTDRQAAEAGMLKRPDAVIAGRFERLDAAIGEAASSVPARQEGRSVMEELGQKVADLVRRAAESVRSVFSSEPRAGASSSGPSPG